MGELILTFFYWDTSRARLAELPQVAIWDAIASANRSLGRVRKRFRSLDPILEWRLHPDDAQILRRAMHVIAQLFFAAGARKILPGVGGIPDSLGSAEEAAASVPSWR